MKIKQLITTFLRCRTCRRSHLNGSFRLTNYVDLTLYVCRPSHMDGLKVEYPHRDIHLRVIPHSGLGKVILVT